MLYHNRLTYQHELAINLKNARQLSMRIKYACLKYIVFPSINLETCFCSASDTPDSYILSTVRKTKWRYLYYLWKKYSSFAAWSVDRLAFVKLNNVLTVSQDEVDFEGDQSEKKHLSAWNELKWKKCSLNININI